MDPFVRKLVERLLDEGAPLSRNRHFHTFESPEGRQALRVFRRLQALRASLLACEAQGGTPRVTARADEVQVELRLQRPRTVRTTHLDGEEVELLYRLPGVREALVRAGWPGR